MEGIRFPPVDRRRYDGWTAGDVVVCPLFYASFGKEKKSVFVQGMMATFSKSITIEYTDKGDERPMHHIPSQTIIVRITDGAMVISPTKSAQKDCKSSTAGYQSPLQ
jgi:hypothetical protein